MGQWQVDLELVYGLLDAVLNLGSGDRDGRPGNALENYVAIVAREPGRFDAIFKLVKLEDVAILAAGLYRFKTHDGIPIDLIDIRVSPGRRCSNVTLSS